MAWAPTYATDAELRSYLRISDGDDDPRIAGVVEAASRAVDRATRRQVGGIDEAAERRVSATLDRSASHQRPGLDRPRWIVDIDDLMTTTDLAISIRSADVTTYTLEPVNAASYGRPWEQLIIDATSGIRPWGEPHEVYVTALWGWSAVPTTVREATLLQAARFFKRRDAPFGVAGSPDLGSEMRLLDKVDPDVAVMLRDYRRDWAVA